MFELKNTFPVGKSENWFSIANGCQKTKDEAFSIEN